MAKRVLKGNTWNQLKWPHEKSRDRMERNWQRETKWHYIVLIKSHQVTGVTPGTHNKCFHSLCNSPLFQAFQPARHTAHWMQTQPPCYRATQRNTSSSVDGCMLWKKGKLKMLNIKLINEWLSILALTAAGTYLFYGTNLPSLVPIPKQNTA